MKKYFKMLWKIILYFIIYYLAQIACSVLAAIIISKIYKVGSMTQLSDLLDKNLYMVLLPAGAIALLIYSLMFRGKEKSLKERCGFRKVKGHNKRKIIFLGLSVGAFSTSLIYLTQNIFKDYANVSKSFSAGLTSLPGIISVIIIVPIVEEILFRGLIFNELRENLNLVASLVIQALLFALAHGNMLQGIYTFVVGILAGLIYIWTNSIVSNMILHITFNLAGTFIFPVLIYFTQSLVPFYMAAGFVLAAIFMVKIYKTKENSARIDSIEQSI